MCAKFELIRTYVAKVTTLSVFKKANFTVSMEFARSDMRAIIYYNYKRGLTQKACKSELDATFGVSAPAKGTISFWYGEFRRGRKSTEDEPRSGRPTSSATQENIDAIRKIVEDDPHATYENI